jgi:propanol-preferring alcohol dehydrogenase
MMRAMVLEKPGQPLQMRPLPRPQPGPDEVCVRVLACAVCRTDLHVVDGELPDPKLPLIPGHEIVGEIEQVGANVTHLAPGQRVGIPWLAWTCGHCRYCRAGLENLCDQARFTGYTVDGGYAEYTKADARYCFALPENLEPVKTAPLLCAGLIGYRCLRKAGDAVTLGLYGFGAAAHLVAQVARHEGRRVFAFTRPGDTAAQALALRLGAVWVGGSDQLPPEKLDAAIIFAPVGTLVPLALRAVRKGGLVVCGGIHMSDIPSFPYRDLWQERVLCSVANLTRRDAEEFLQWAGRFPLQVETTTLPLSAANEALDRLRSGRLVGAAVLVP